MQNPSLSRFFIRPLPDMALRLKIDALNRRIQTSHSELQGIHSKIQQPKCSKSVEERPSEEKKEAACKVLQSPEKCFPEEPCNNIDNEGRTYENVGQIHENVEEPRLTLQQKDLQVYAKWESLEGGLIAVVIISNTSTLSDLRRSIGMHIQGNRQNFTFLMLGDAGGAPVAKELEGELLVHSLPTCIDVAGSRLASLRAPPTRKLFKAPALAPVHEPLKKTRPGKIKSGSSKFSLKAMAYTNYVDHLLPCNSCFS